MEKIWLDTDIGSDIDDAVALAYLLSKPECKLIGISTVSGEAVKRAQIADALCNVAGKSIPIFPGAEKPIIGTQRQPKAPQANKLYNWKHETEATFQPNTAVKAMYQAIKENPGEITLLAIGPLTNVALLLRTHPDVVGMLKSVMLMAGAFLENIPMRRDAEWNVRCDTIGAAMVFAEKGLRIRCVGLDVTLKVQLDKEQTTKRFATPLLQAVRDFADAWFAHRDDIIFHDPLAAACMFVPDIVTYKRGFVKVELGGEGYGRTDFIEDENGLHEIAVAVDAAAMLEEYFKNQK